MSSEPPPSTGLIAGKYELLGMIGRGGMGSVWEGRHTSLRTRVAIKFIEAEYANSEEARSRFEREARAAATIQSKHAIQIHDHGVTHDGKPYIVMELLVGEPLDKRIDRMGRLTLQDTARILQQVCRGLHRAHERGIIHRDLKPENVFLVRTEEDDDEVAKVLDFGIAKMKSPEGMGISSSTKTGAVLGTPFFMSPEQARGLRNVDHRSDVWSIGVIAFKCVTGALPFDGESVGDLLVKICTAPPPVPSQVVPGLPPAFDAWFARALDRDPERRFASVMELSDALAFSAGVSVRRPLGSQGTPEPYGAGYAPSIPSSGVANMHGHPGGATPGPMVGHPTPGPATRSSPQYPAQAIPTATSAPFTHSTPAGVPRTSRGAIVAASIVAFILMGGLGVYGVTRFTSGRTGANANNATGTPSAAAANVGTTPITSAAGVGGGSTEVRVAASASAVLTAPPPPVTASAAPLTQNKPPKRPPAPPTPVLVKPIPPGPPPPVVTPPKPPVVPPSKPPVDPGY